LILFLKSKSKDRSFVSLDSSYKSKSAVRPGDFNSTEPASDSSAQLSRASVGAAEGCDLLICFLKAKSKDRSLVSLDSSYKSKSAVRPGDFNSTEPASDSSAQLSRASVGAAEGCDLLILFLKSKIKRSQPRFTRQLLQEQVGCQTGRLQQH
jgi:hypothetical protein